MPQLSCKAVPCLQVPPDFDPGCIAEVVDSSADKLAQTLPIAVMERVDALRHQVCFQPLPSIALHTPSTHPPP